jgi:hypothetical protein
MVAGNPPGVGLGPGLGVTGSTPDISVAVGSGIEGSSRGTSGRMYRVATNMMAARATNTKTVDHDCTTRAVARSRSSVKSASVRSRWAERALTTKTSAATPDET